MVNVTHSSQNTASEYEAKHEPDVAKKMASLWENKVNENDGGKLSPTFAKAPGEVAASRKPIKHKVVATKVSLNSAGGVSGGMGARGSSRSSSNSSNSEADSGPARTFTRNKSVVEMKSNFEKSKGASKEELEEEVRKAVAEANAKAAREAKVLEEARAKSREEQRMKARETLSHLERQLATMNETVAVLRAQVDA